MDITTESHIRDVTIAPLGLKGLLGLGPEPHGLIIFAHGSGSGRLSPRNGQVAQGLRRAGFATLLLDLLTEAEEGDRANVFDIPLLASRLLLATRWARSEPETAGLPIGFFGASTGAGAALMAAAEFHDVRAVVSRGGRPDLAGPALAEVVAPTLLIVGSLDTDVLALNRAALAEMHAAPGELVVVPGAGHLFEQPGTLEQVLRHASAWFLTHVPVNA